MSRHYDLHRFDNPSAWLDRVERSKARAEGRPLGYGFTEPKPPLSPREEKPFYVQEYSFTSGHLINRKYSQFGSSFSSETTRADPWHYPNCLEVEDADHYKDHQRRSQNYDPRFWKPDPALSGKIPESLVSQHVAAHRSQTKADIDPKKIEAFFSEDVRPQRDYLHELNADLSCVTLPSREGGSSPRARGPASRGPASRSSGRPLAGGLGGAAAPPASAASSSGAPAAGQVLREGAGDGRWKWCLGGRPQVALGQPSPEDMQLTKSRSQPQMLSGISTLAGNIGGQSSPFHGSFERKFGTGTWDGRMRGGKLARSGWAGTFPSKDM